MNNNRQRSLDTGLATNLILLLCFVFTRQESFVYAAIIVLILVMTIPGIFHYPSIVWFYITHKLGVVVSFVIMNVIFTCVVVPVGFVRRLMGKNSLNIHSFKKSCDSNFHERNHRYTAQDLEKPY